MAAYFQQLAQQFTNPITAIAQILGFAAMLLGYFVFCFRQRGKIIAAKAACDFAYAVHYFMLAQWTGAAVCTVNIFRGILFSQRGKYKWSSSVMLPIVFLVLTVGSSLLTWTGPESLLPMVGSCLAVLGYWCTNTSHLRKLNFVGISLWAAYSVITMSVPSLLSNLIYLSSIVRTEIKEALRKRREIMLE